jgi:hypothetical protein
MMRYERHPAFIHSRLAPDKNHSSISAKTNPRKLDLRQLPLRKLHPTIPLLPQLLRRSLLPNTSLNMIPEHGPRPILRPDQLHITAFHSSPLQLPILIIHNREDFETLTHSELAVELSIHRSSRDAVPEFHRDCEVLNGGDRGLLIQFGEVPAVSQMTVVVDP